jgi:hypothetical protein
MMFYTACICTVIMTSFVILLGLPEDKQSEKTRTAVSALIIIYSWFFGAGWISPCWQYAPEISPLELRHVGGALNASGEWLWSFVTVFASPIAQGNPSVGWKVWLWYLVFNILAIPFTYYLPETGKLTIQAEAHPTPAECLTSFRSWKESGRAGHTLLRCRQKGRLDARASKTDASSPRSRSQARRSERRRHEARGVLH